MLKNKFAPHQETNPKLRLSHHTWNRRFFDATSREDIKEYIFFLENSRWSNNCPFELEWPYLNINDMIRAKLVDCHIELILKNAK
jgi:hypothetical protein